jgi:hypothetical protein
MVLSHLDELVIPCVEPTGHPFSFCLIIKLIEERFNFWVVVFIIFVCSHPFRFVCQAFTLRYPNPFAPHVITADTLERSWDAESGILRSSRLVLKRGTLPSWAPRGIVEKSETWVLEESTINILDGTMTLSNRNLDHRRVMEVIERITLRALGEVWVFAGNPHIPSY